MATIPRVTTLDPNIAGVFGPASDPMPSLVARAMAAYPDTPPILWEGDARTFEFSFVSVTAEQIVGYPVRRWVEEPTFWADVVVVGDDRDEAIGYCALATMRGRDHTFEYRARTADGRVIWLRDFVKVIDDPSGKSGKRLRGIMFDVTAEKLARSSNAIDVQPPRTELEQPSP